MSRWPSVDEIVEMAHHSADTSEFRARCLARLAPLVGCDAALMQDAWPGSPAVPGGCLDIEFGAVSQISENLPYYRRDMLPLLHTVASERVAVDVEVLGEGRVQSLALTREIIAPLGLGDVLLVGVPRRLPGRMTLLNFLRSSGRHRPFSTTARDRLHALVPILSLSCEAIPETPRPTLDVLSPNERAIVEWLRLGYSNAQIALVLDVSVSAVKNRLLRLYKRVGVESRTELLFTLGLLRG